VPGADARGEITGTRDGKPSIVAGHDGRVAPGPKGRETSRTMPLTTSSGKAPFLRCRRSRERRRATALLLAVLRQAVSQVAGDAQSCANGSAHGGTDGLHPHERLVASRSVQACRSRPSQPWRTSSPMVCESSSGGVTSASRGSARALQPSPARGATAECVAKRSCDVGKVDECFVA